MELSDEDAILVRDLLNEAIVQRRSNVVKDLQSMEVNVYETSHALALDLVGDMNTLQRMLRLRLRLSREH